MRIERSRSGVPVVGVGGGAYSNTFRGRWVERGGALPPPLFLHTSGPLACEVNQAVVALRPGDVVVQAYGALPVDLETASVEADRIFSIPVDGMDIGTEPVKYTGPIPESVVTGLSRYHNRDGSLFVAAASEE